MENKINFSLELQNHYIIGVGFSAGGMEPLNTFFDHTSHDRASYVIIQHLPPDYKSSMAELLSKHSKLTVYEIENGMLVEPNCVYLVPERKNITINKGRLYLSEVQRIQPNTAIDIFLDSLATDYKNKSIAVILSGTGTDGTKGCFAIKNAGGLVIVQDPDTAPYTGMPNSVIESGCAHMILAPENMPETILDYIAESSLAEKLTTDLKKEDEECLIQILELIKQNTPLDFTNYKRPTIIRRITRRMVENNRSSIKDYSKRLLDDPTEIEILTKEFMISVTHFFRDTEVFETLERTVIPEIIQHKLTIDQLKVWVVGCATGEEAYSLAILIKEYLQENNIELEVKIFASDIDKDALMVASKGKYPLSLSNDLTQERLDKFFTREGDFYKVKDSLRRMVIFAHHDIIKQPPYAKIDLITCRNLLIYLNPILQKKVLSTLHFCLNPGGYLLLGQSESIGQTGRFFSEVDKKGKIYKNIEPSKTIGNVSYLANSGGNPDQHMIKQIPIVKSSSTFGENNLPLEILNSILETTEYEACVYINDQFNIIHPLGKYENYLLPKRFNFNLIELLPEQLALAVGTATNKAFEDKKPFLLQEIVFREAEKVRTVDVLVKPIITEHTKNALVLFRKNMDSIEQVMSTEQFNLDVHTSRYLADLENKLQKAKAELIASQDIIQSFNDYAKAYNEELVASNEEMQSTNEELQSVNEELQTVNSEHQAKIKELAELNDDLTNYFRGSVNGQIFVDRNLIIKRFTPAATKQINLIENDIGRSLTNISTNILYEGMLDDISRVISNSIVCEKEIQLKDEHWFHMIIKPYVRLKDNRIDGAIITFNDITLLKKAQETLIEANADALIQKNIDLMKINRDLDGFIYTASHDLRSPISNLEGLLDVIQEHECSHDEKLKPLLEMMELSVKKLNKTIIELTEVSKIQKTIQEDIQEIVLCDLIEDVKFSISDLINRKNPSIILNLDKCPTIKFSTKNLRSILYNLISNALKYSSPDRKPEIVISTQSVSGFCILTVKDNGLGMTKLNLNDIFSMFTRFHDHIEGTGIGLYMVNRIIENAGGRIEVDSEVGQGSTFTIYFKQN